jgi:hypothetical protein
LPVEISDNVPLGMSYSYASLLPFVSCGISASAVLKNTRPSFVTARFRYEVFAAPPWKSLAMTSAGTVAGAPVGLHDAHTTVFVSALYTYTSRHPKPLLHGPWL